MAIATLALLALPATASASTIEVTASSGPSAEEYLEYRTTQGENNRVQVLFARNSVVIVDRGTKRITLKSSPFGRCRATSRQRVVCPSFSLSAYLRGGDDRLSVAPGDEGSAPDSTDPLAYAEDYEDTEGAVVETLWVDGGPGNDTITGSKFNDVFVPGTGADRVEGRDGPDRIYNPLDGQVDSFTGGGGVDAVSFRSEDQLVIDLLTDLGGREGELDKIKRIERAHGGEGRDVLRGSHASDALYGEAGDDHVHGRGGNDLLVGDSPLTTGGDINLIWGDEGDDLVDTRAGRPRYSLVDCGPGADRHMGGADTRITGCEHSLLRVAFGSLTTPDGEDVLYDDPMKVAPVAKTADSVTFEVPCPQRRNAQCKGSVTLESPSSGGGTPTQYGVGEFTAPPGSRQNVTVALNAAGQAAVAGDGPVGVRVHVEFTPPSPDVLASHADAGWQEDL